MFWRNVSRHVVSRVVVEMDTLQVVHIAIAIRQQHRERNVVDDEPAEVNRRNRENGLDTIRRSQRLIELKVLDDALATTRVTHGPDSFHVDLADELRSKRRAADG